MMTETLAKTFSVLFIASFFYAMISSYLLRWMIDEEKIKTEGAKVFRAITPPRSILTPRGLKVWWSKWIALGASLIFVTVSILLFENLEK